MQRFLSIAGLLLTAACSSGGGNVADTASDSMVRTCGPEGPVRYLVVRTLGIGRVAEGISSGFDLDASVTAPGGPTGCGVADHVGPDGTVGIDNAFAGLMPFLDSTEAAALEPLLQQKINEGELTLLIEVSGLDDLVQDDCVAVRMLRGSGLPQLGTDGLILEDQTFDLDPAVQILPAVEGTVQDGVLEARGIAFDLPVVVFDFDMVLELSDAALRLDVSENGSASGVLGSGFRWQPLLEELLTTPIDITLQKALPVLLAQLADLRPDEEGVCQELSAVLEVSTAGAFVFEDALQ